jgi:flagellar protein FlaF
MNVERLARRAYARPDTDLRDLRGMEYDLLADCTKALKAATAGEGWNYPALAAAVERNLRLWTIFAADVANPDNSLTQDLRGRLFYLYEFTALHSRAVLDGAGSVDVLIDINMAVMRGLRGGAA